MSQEPNKRGYGGIILYTLFFLGLIVWGIYLQFSPDKNSIWNYAYNIGSGLVYIFGGLIGYFYSRNNDMGRQEKSAILHLVLGQVLWGLASFIWAYYNIALNIEVPFPSIADIFFVAFAVCDAVALWYLLNSGSDTLTQKNIEGSLFIIMFCYAVTFYIFWRLPVAADVTFMEAMPNFMYPIIETFIIALAFVAVQLSDKRFKRGVAFILLGMVLQLLADFLFGYSEMLGLYWNGGLTDILYVASGFVLSMAIIKLSLKQTHA